MKPALRASPGVLRRWEAAQDQVHRDRPRARRHGVPGCGRLGPREGGGLRGARVPDQLRDLAVVPRRGSVRWYSSSTLTKLFFQVWETLVYATAAQSVRSTFRFSWNCLCSGHSLSERLGTIPISALVPDQLRDLAVVPRLGSVRWYSSSTLTKLVFQVWLYQRIPGCF